MDFSRHCIDLDNPQLRNKASASAPQKPTAVDSRGYMKSKQLKVFFRCSADANLIIALVLALLTSGLLVARVVAHGPEVLLKTDPVIGAVLKQPPSKVTAWFSTELDTKLSTLQVFDAQGRQVDLGDGGVDLDDPDHASLVASLPTLPDGVYLVRWSAVLDDGDAVEGEFTFTVGEGRAAATESTALQQATTEARPEWLGIFILAGLVLAVVVGISIVLWRQKQTGTQKDTEMIGLPD